MRMVPWRGARIAAISALGLVLVGGAAVLSAAAPEDEKKTADTAPRWIWLGTAPKEAQTVYFRKAFEAPEGVTAAKLVATCDNAMTIYLDGREILSGIDWNAPISRDVTSFFQAKGVRGHMLAARGGNEGGPAGLLVRLSFETKSGPVTIVSDASWRVTDRRPTRDWNTVRFDDSSWLNATVVGALGDGPWTAVTAASLDAAKRGREPQATAANSLKVKKDFKVELVYTVPKETQGSWVNLTFDPDGRLIVSDQYGKLYTVTLPPIGGKTSDIKVEPIDVAIGEAQGLCWAFDSLYVVVNRGRTYESGLYRVRDSDGDGKLDKVEQLRKLDGGGEHGPHAVIPGPDHNSLYVVAGNATKLTELAGSLVPRIWGEDEVLPHMPDGRGFMANETAPGGCVYRIDPDGKSWTLVSMGYRNPYDLAFNRYGDLFTYDSDMEWDMNLPWYRPTRVCQVDSGSDFGYRNGSGKWPAYYLDSLPPTINIGPGSPTGVTFGYGAKFPARYQEALFICDWSYGKLYAVHMQPKGAEYQAELEEFVTGTPLPLTDIAVSPTDGAMYFAIGGRNTQSGLYRVTYAGNDSTAAAVPDANDPGANARSIRCRLDDAHRRRDASAVQNAWVYLGDSDRFLRYAARVAIEFQDPDSWRERALSESNPEAAINALLALVRVSARDPIHRKPTDPKPDPALRGRILDALERIDWAQLSMQQKLDLLRVYGVLFARMGPFDDATASRVTDRFRPIFPTRARELNAELCQLLVALQDPSVAPKAIELLAKAPTQEEQIDYARMLRVLRTGWTPELRRSYFTWFLKAANFKGGNSLSGFLSNIRRDALSTLSETEKAELKPILDTRPQAEAVAVAPPRPFVKAWTLDELTPIVESGLKGRDYDRGRTLFAAAQCFSCHRYNDEGGSTGPDLSGVSGRFSVRDLLESMVQPSKTISDQYQAVMIAMADGRTITGRIVNLHGDALSVNTNMLDPNGLVSLDAKQVEEIKPSPVSMMPEGLLNSLHEAEILDLVAYLLSRGDRENAMFQSRKNP
jgi:putative heme-binding domain-containing protein